MSPLQPLTMRSIAADICAAAGITLEELQGQRRARKFSRPRQEFMWRCRQVFRLDGVHRYSTPKIGMFLDGRDHSTVIHGVRRYAAKWGKA